MVCQKTISLFYNTLQQKWSVRNRTLHSYTNTADHVTMKNCKCECETYFNVEPNKAQYELSDFTFENLDIQAKNDGFKADAVENMKIINVNVVIEA